MQSYTIYDDPLDIIGQTIDGFLVQEYLTSGGTAHIYRAELDDVTVVIKLLRSEFANDPDAKRRFHKEIFALKQVKHRNIVQLLADGQSDYGLFIVFEYAPLGSLQDYVERMQYSMTLGDVAIIIQQIADALHSMHENNFIHRDVKPSNILMRKPTDVALADFGIVRHDDVNKRFPVQPGTIDFMAPEQIDGIQADFTTDQYALAITTYWLLTGHKPYEAENREDALFQRSVGSPSVKDFNPVLPAEFDDVLHRAMQFKMENRYHFVEEFTHNIAQIIDSQRISDIPALGRSPARLNISSTDNALATMPIKPMSESTSSHKQLKDLMNPYGKITIAILSLMLVVMIGYLAIPKQRLDPPPMPSGTVISNLMFLTANPANFSCDVFIPLYQNLYTEVNNANPDYVPLVALTAEESATKTVYVDTCVADTGENIVDIAPALWEQMRDEISQISDN